MTPIARENWETVLDFVYRYLDRKHRRVHIRGAAVTYLQHGGWPAAIFEVEYTPDTPTEDNLDRLLWLTQVTSPIYLRHIPDNVKRLLPAATMVA